MLVTGTTTTSSTTETLRALTTILLVEVLGFHLVRLSCMMLNALHVRLVQAVMINREAFPCLAMAKTV